jgi:hypothetical protein
VVAAHHVLKSAIASSRSSISWRSGLALAACQKFNFARIFCEIAVACGVDWAA